MLIFKNKNFKSKSLNESCGKNIGGIQSYCKVGRRVEITLIGNY